MKSLRFYGIRSAGIIGHLFSKIPYIQSLKNASCACLITFLIVYVVFIFGFIVSTTGVEVRPTRFTRTTPIPADRNKLCDKDIPLTHDATKNQLLTFYGNKELLKTPEVFIPSNKVINPLNYNFTIVSREACPPNSKPTLFIMVLTQHEHFQQRKAIRDTWGGIAKNKPWFGRKLHGEVRMVFLLGESSNHTLNTQVIKEASETMDIVQANFRESYFNLTMKVLMGMKWIELYCPKTQFVMKMDEDTFADIPRILNLLVSLDWSNTIYGPYSFAEKVVRHRRYGTSSKAAVSVTAYSVDWYPPHVKGNMYIMPYELAMKIMNVSQYFPYMNIEDVHITGILAKVFDARHMNIPVDLYEKHPNGDPNFCDFVFEKKIAAQGIYPALVRNFWDRIQNTQMCGIISVENVLNDFSSRHDIVSNMHKRTVL